MVTGSQPPSHFLPWNACGYLIKLLVLHALPVFEHLAPKASLAHESLIRYEYLIGVQIFAK